MGRHLDKIEGGAQPFVEGVTTPLAAKHGTAQISSAL